MFKVNYRNNRKRCEISSNLTIKTPERRQWLCYGVFIVNFKHISHLFGSNYFQKLIFPKIVTKPVYIRKRIKSFRFHVNRKKTFPSLITLRIHFVSFSSNFDPSPKQFIAVRKNVNASLSKAMDWSRIRKKSWHKCERSTNPLIVTQI